jgi:hypothetical protein
MLKDNILERILEDNKRGAGCNICMHADAHTDTDAKSALGNTEALRLASEARTQKRNQGKVLHAWQSAINCSQHNTAPDTAHHPARRQTTRLYKPPYNSAIQEA